MVLLYIILAAILLTASVMLAVMNTSRIRNVVLVTLTTIIILLSTMGIVMALQVGHGIPR